MLFYVIGALFILLAILIIFLVRRISYQVAARRARRAQSTDLETADLGLGRRPTLSGTANDVGQALHLTPRHGNAYVPRHMGGPGLGSAAQAEREWGRGSFGTEVTRVESREADGELPSYQQSRFMPKPPPSVYDPTSPRASLSTTHAGSQTASTTTLNVPPPGYTATAVPASDLPATMDQLPAVPPTNHSIELTTR